MKFKIKLIFLILIEMPRNYIPKGKRNYHKWVLDHKDEILAIQNNNERVNWVMKNLNDELKLNMDHNKIYQLLYRNDMITHRNNA